MISKQLIGVFVWLVASTAAYWLARADAGVADAPAQLMASEFRVAAADTGRITEVRVKPGQRVRTGDVLARLETTLVEREIAVAEARLRQLAAEPAATSAALESDGYSSERSFQSDVDTAAGHLEAARTSQAAHAAELKTLREEIGRQRQLVSDGLTRADRVEQLELQARNLSELAAAWPARLDTLAAQLQAAQARLREWRTQHKASTAPVARDARLRPLRDRIAEQRQAIELLRARAASATIVAPADGAVAAVLAQTGDVAHSGVPILLLHGTGPRVLVAYVNERARLAPGAKALVRRRTVERDEIAAEVRRVSDSVVQLPPRFWLLPTMPQWGREVYLDVPPAANLDAGEAFDVKFLTGGGM
ncbi:MAG: biotin/lipoyl-binding protein [Bryobacterales bacterium]|nr:biotin/lipoyl-binding protein [Bryobacterales bacterium]